MVARHSDATKLNEAKQIAKENGCFIIERIQNRDNKGNFVNVKFWILYRNAEPTNVYIGKRSSIAGIVALVNKAGGKK